MFSFIWVFAKPKDATGTTIENVSTRMEDEFAAEALDKIAAAKLATTKVTATKTNAMNKVDRDEFKEAAWRKKNGKILG